MVWSGEGARRQARVLESLRPGTAEELDRFLTRVLGVRIPRRAMCTGHVAPFEYLMHVFFERPGEPIVWANRGGGKTYLGAVATLLDLVFKPGVRIRILGGSFEQSSRMYAYLLELMERPGVRGLAVARPTQRRIELVNGSAVELLSQSQTSVRGVRVHKLRCDEVELFDEQVWQAAQLVTQSGMCGEVWVRGVVEVFSTIHRPFGLMSRLVKRVDEEGATGKVLFKWRALDVIEQCPAARDCRRCPIEKDCRGGAKEARGFMQVDDLVAMRLRSSEEAWASEMLCRMPRRSDCVYARFDPARHVVAGARTTIKTDELVIGGVDFGLRSPFVMLWARMVLEDEREVLEVIDEYVRTDRTLREHLGEIAARRWPRPRWVGVDPAGAQRNAQTGLSDISVLRCHGLLVRYRYSSIREGIERIRRRLDSGTLRIHARCRKLIEAMGTYHFDLQRLENDAPVKDGPDHACDALRYLVVNLEMGSRPVASRRYV